MSLRTRYCNTGEDSRVQPVKMHPASGAQRLADAAGEYPCTCSCKKEKGAEQVTWVRSVGQNCMSAMTGIKARMAPYGTLWHPMAHFTPCWWLSAV